MDDPTTLVGAKSEPSASAINPELASAANPTFSQGLQTVREPDVSAVVFLLNIFQSNTLS